MKLIPRPAEEVQDKLSSDGPKVLGLLRGLFGFGNCCGWNSGEWPKPKSLSGMEALVYGHTWDSTVEDGNGVMYGGSNAYCWRGQYRVDMVDT